MIFKVQLPEKKNSPKKVSFEITIIGPATTIKIDAIDSKDPGGGFTEEFSLDRWDKVKLSWEDIHGKG